MIKEADLSQYHLKLSLVTVEIFSSNIPFRPWTIVHGSQITESARKIHSNRS